MLALGAFVGTQESRSSDRIYLELAVTITGTDEKGRGFKEDTRTLVVSRGGAKIVSRHALAPQQKLQIRCLKTGHEADLRVVGPIGGDEEGTYYGVALLNAGADFWGINFPLLDSTVKAASRLLLECTRCQSQAVAHLDVFELEVLLANECLMRSCPKCADMSLWMPPGTTPRPSSGDAAPPTPRHLVHERKDPRISLKVEVCIRHSVHGEEVVVTENVSRGGFRFRSSRDYPVATLIEAALPYVAGAANIFAPARIVYREPHPAQGKTAYGVAYVPSQMASSLTGMRISSPG